MSKELSIPQTSEYRAFLIDLKQRLHTAQVRSALAANAELMTLYGYGRSIITLQQEKAWGSSVVKQLSQDFMNAYPGVSGFSRTHLFAMRQMALFFDPDSVIVPQAVGQLPWGHTRVLMAKTKERATAECVVRMTHLLLASFFVRIETDSMSNMPCETSISQSGSVHSNSMKFRAIYKLSCQLQKSGNRN